MPYIRQEDRKRIDHFLTDVRYIANDATSGTLNYIITSVLTAFLGPRPRYDALNAAIGALECAKLELYRRVAAPYEDRKCEENDDVYQQPSGHTSPMETCQHPKCVAKRAGRNFS